jgi:hypothetical protein
MIILGSRQSSWFGMTLYALQVAYVAGLLWFLHRSGPSVADLPQIASQRPSGRTFRHWTPVVLIAALLVLQAVSDDGSDILFLSLVVATVWTLVALWRQIRLRFVVQGAAIATVAYLVAIPMASNGTISPFIHVLFSVLTLPMYVAGVLLSQHTGLAGACLVEGDYRLSLMGLVWGAVLFVPLGLVNVADGPWGFDTSWVTEMWMPLSLPWFSGIVEEVLWRLLVVSLCCFLLGPALRSRPGSAVLASVLVSGIAFGLFHGRTVDNLLTTGLLYGVPMAAVFAKRNWEHAVGAHFMVNLPSWIVAMLENQ